MTPEQFKLLCKGGAAQLGLPNQDALFDSGDVWLDGVKLGVFHLEDWDSEGIYCYVDLGSSADRSYSTETLEALMELNLVLDGNRGEVIGIERESRHLVLKAKLGTTADVHPGLLADGLRRYARLANQLYGNCLADLVRPAEA